MANQYGFDLGQTLKGVEDIKTARQNREMNSLRMTAAQDELDSRKAERVRQNVLSGMRQKAVGGDQDAFKQLMALDPEAGKTFADGLKAMNEPQLEQAKQNMEEMGRMIGSILQAKTPQEKEGMYQQMLQALPPESRKRLPAKYNEQRMVLEAAKLRTMDKIMENPSVIQMGNEDVMVQGGREVGRANRPLKETQPSGVSAPKTSDYNLVYRSIVPSLGGTIDDQGNIRGLEDSTELTAIAELGAKLLRTGEAASPIEAGAMALRQFGKNFKTPLQSSDPMNPAAISEKFLGRAD